MSLSHWPSTILDQRSISTSNFQSYFKSVEYLNCFHPNFIEVITTKLCTCHENCDVMACAKLCSNLITRNWIATKYIVSIKFELKVWRILNEMGLFSYVNSSHGVQSSMTTNGALHPVMWSVDLRQIISSNFCYGMSNDKRFTISWPSDDPARDECIWWY